MKSVSFFASLALLSLFVLLSTGGFEKTQAQQASEKADIEDTKHAIQVLDDLVSNMDKAIEAGHSSSLSASIKRPELVDEGRMRYFHVIPAPRACGTHVAAGVILVTAVREEKGKKNTPDNVRSAAKQMATYHANEARRSAEQLRCDGHLECTEKILRESKLDSAEEWPEPYEAADVWYGSAKCTWKVTFECVIPDKKRS